MRVDYRPVKEYRLCLLSDCWPSKIIKVPGAVVQGEFVLQWEAVQGAASYDVYIGPVTRDEEGKINGSYTSSFRTEVKSSRRLHLFSPKSRK